MRGCSGAYVNTSLSGSLNLIVGPDGNARYSVECYLTLTESEAVRLLKIEVVSQVIALCVLDTEGFVISYDII